MCSFPIKQTNKYIFIYFILLKVSFEVALGHFDYKK